MTLDPGADRSANVVGLGLIGGSVALALAQLGWRVHGTDAVEARESEAVERGIVSAVGLDPDAQITFIATPASSVPSVAADVLASTRGLVTDVASVKGRIVTAIDDPRFGHHQTVGLHPVQGRVQRSRADRIAVAPQLLGHPRAVDLTLGRVMEDVQPDRDQLQLPHH